MLKKTFFFLLFYIYINQAKNDKIQNLKIKYLLTSSTLGSRNTQGDPQMTRTIKKKKKPKKKKKHILKKKKHKF